MTRTVMHIDMDSYFASVEQQATPSLRGQPMGVTGRPTEKSIITAFSREAKRYKVWTGMPVWEAQRACPHLILVPGRPERYVETTKRFLEILKRYTPLIEVFSVDEVFMDVTHDAPKHGGPVALARKIQAAFRDALGPYITATIGIAATKTFAKLIAKRHKPNGIGELHSSDMPSLLHSTPVGEICGIGPRIERRLSRMGVRSLAELGELPAHLLRREFGVYGLFLKEIGQGRDPTPLTPYSEIPPPKSVGHSRSLPPDLRPFPLALIILRDLCEKVGRRMRRQGFVGRTVHCGFRLEAMSGHHAKQVTLALPSDDGETIYAACLAVLGKIPVKPTAVNQISVSVSHLSPKLDHPVSLLADDHRRDRINHAVDLIRDRYGETAIRIGCSLLTRPIPRHVSGFTFEESWDF